MTSREFIKSIFLSAQYGTFEGIKHDDLTSRLEPLAEKLQLFSFSELGLELYRLVSERGI